ncbi:non-ribosomal peptide synthetase [Paenibacillus sp. 481]|uniref:non-ribosomal peptide synthetase n=1 Tax=Paenibacillus sp. 481 TaxID=2835869 RepID=UPI001E5E0996|nr:non-ribosomal peptide synthetase [Paenibacillus sp. 481]UHA72708.1 amino acid adenylation domain-containing protein [Paenibacillus sp. 481]
MLHDTPFDYRDLETYLRQQHHSILNNIAVEVQTESIPISSIHLTDIFPHKRKSNSSARKQTPVSTSSSSTEETSTTSPAFCSKEVLLIDEHEPRTLQDILRRAALSAPTSEMIFFNSEGTEERVSYADAWEEAERILGGLQARGLQPQDFVIFQFSTNRSFITALWACILGGFLPAPLGVAPDYREHSAAVTKLYGVWELLEHAVILTNSSLYPSLLQLSELWETEELQIIDMDSLLHGEATCQTHIPSEDELALNLLTSGSTGIPKCVQHTHQSILHMIRSSSTALQLGTDDVWLNWMPLDHVGGLIMSHLQSTYVTCSQVHPQIEQFIADPLQWLHWIDTYCVTSTWAPNFAFTLINSLEDDIQQHHWNLASIRHIINGAEAIVPQTTQKFLTILQPFGLPEDAITAAFGMSELSSVIAYSKHIIRGKEMSGVHVVTQKSLTGTLQFTDPTAEDAVFFTEIGGPLHGVSIRIVDSNHQLLPENTIGRLQINTKQLMRGYYKNPEANAEVFVGEGWFETGDLAFLHKGRLTITGRNKDVIIINGNNYHNYEIESCVEELSGIRVTFTAACGISDGGTGQESLAIFFVPVDDDVPFVMDMINQIREHVTRKFGIYPEYVIPLNQQQFPKTNSGKIQRIQLSKNWMDGQYSEIQKQIDLYFANENTLPNWFYQPVWIESDIDNTMPQSPVNEDMHVVFVDQEGLWEQFKGNAIYVEIGDHFEQITQNRYRINPSLPMDYVLLLQALENEGVQRLHIYHLWNYSVYDGELATLAHLRNAQVIGSHSLLLLVKALQERVLVELSITIVTTNALVTSKSDHVAYEKATIIGLLKTVSQEMPLINCRLVDFDITCPVTHGRILAQEALHLEQGSIETLVAYRGQKRLVERIEKMMITDNVKQEIPFKQKGNYLITGLGGISQLVASYLLENFEARLVILGRTELANWSREIKKQYEALCELAKKNGGSIEFKATDITNEDSVRTIVHDAESNWSEQLDGIIHLAGVIEERLLTDLMVEELEAQYEAKVYGSYVLHQIALQRPNCQFIAASSARSFLSGMTLGGYCSANGFVEVFTQYQHYRCGTNAACFAWSVWDEIGMSRNLITKQALLARGYMPITSYQGIYSLLAGLMTGRAMLFIGIDGSKQDFRDRNVELVTTQHRLYAFVETKEAQHIQTSQIVNSITEFLKNEAIEHQVRVKKLNTLPLTEHGQIDRAILVQLMESETTKRKYVLAETELEKQLVQMWLHILAIKQLSVEDNFFALGGHSLKATQLVSRIKERFQADVTLQDLFLNPTVRQFAALVQRRLGIGEQSSVLQQYSRGDHVPMSYAQKRQWFLYKWEPDNPYYNNTFSLRLRGPLHVDILSRSVQSLVDRHETLRTNFDVIDDVPMQVISAERRVNMGIHDLSSLPPSDREQEWNRLCKQEASTPFQLTDGPLIRFRLFKWAEQEHVLLTTIHHIISDGWSVGVLMRDLNAYYTAEVQSVQADIRPLPLQYADYAIWHNNWLTEHILEDQLLYWQHQLQEAPFVLDLPTDCPRPAIQTFKGKRINWRIDPELSHQLRQVSQSGECTLFMTLISAFSTLMYRYTGQKDLLIGTAIANRTRTEIEDLVGFFVNTLVLRFSFLDNPTFREHLQRVKQTTLAAYQHQDVPFEMLIDELHVERDASRSPLIQVLFILQNENLEVTEMHDLQTELQIVENDSAQFELTVHVFERDDQLTISLDYNTDLFSDELIARLLMHYEQLLKHMAANLHSRVGDVPLVSDAELQQLASFHDTELQRVHTVASIHEWFEQQVVCTPNQVACTDDTSTLTYWELNEKANQLARFLRTKGVERNSVVLLQCERSVEMIVGLLGILKSGGAFLPVDPELPSARIAYIVEDSESSVLVTRSGLSVPDAFCGEIVLLDDDCIYSSDETSNLQLDSAERDLLYVIYTSGTTGRPKGVQLEHKTLLNLIAYQQEQQAIPFDRVLQFTTLSFDVCYQEIFSTLLCGGELHIIDNEQKRDVQQLIAFVKQRNIRTLFIPTSFLKFMASEQQYIEPLAKCVDHIITAGEQLVVTKLLHDTLIKYNVELHNHYGPSETHVVTMYTIDRNQFEEVPSIGKPISMTEIFILNENGQIQPIGVIGELYITGVSLARGYHNQAELTQQKFVQLPVASDRLMYRTGDLVRWLPNGMLEYMGRTDHQVKIRGYRIELSEIEAILHTHDAVKEAVVISIGEGAYKYLCAYVVVDEASTVSELRTFVSASLPDYMIPSYFVKLARLPLTHNGKLDRRLLPEPDVTGMVSEGEFEAPATDIEQRIAAIWKDVLKVNDISVTDNFFRLGGHSLTATILVSRLQKEFKVQYPLRELFTKPTIRDLGRGIEALDVYTYAPIPSLALQADYPASSAQKRLYAISQYEGAALSYNMPVILQVDGPLEVERLRAAIQLVVNRHEILRTSFTIRQGELVQLIADQVEIALSFDQLEVQQVPSRIEAFVRPFDLSEAPLLHVELLQITKESHLLLLDRHHIVFDGVSMNIFMQELIEAYDRADAREPLLIQYKDFVAWQQEQLTRSAFEQESFWLDTLAGDLPVLQLPTDYSRPLVKSFAGMRQAFVIDADLTKQLHRCSEEHGATLYMLLLAVFNIMLAKYSGQADIIVGAPVTNRPHPDVDPLIGMFVNTLALRNEPTAEKTVAQFIAEVRHNMLAALEHQDYPLELLVDKLTLDRDLSRNPLFDVLLVLQNMSLHESSSNELTFTPYPFSHPISKFDLTLDAIEKDGQIHFELEYATTLFASSTIERMGNHFIQLLRHALQQPEREIGELQMITKAEWTQLLDDFSGEQMEYACTMTLERLFATRVSENPARTALVCNDQTMTYGEVDAKANQLAHLLLKHGLSSGDVVAVMTERSFEMVIFILAVLKAGAIYLPLDPGLPQERIEFVLADSHAKLLLVKDPLTARLEYAGVVVTVNESELSTEVSSPITHSQTAEDVVYMIYTSGSTGNPKGVMVQHKSVINMLTYLEQSYPLLAEDAYLLKTTYTFDVSVTELFGWFFGHGRLVILEPGAEKDPEKMIAAIAQHGITHINFVPSMLGLFPFDSESIRNMEELKYVFVAGEALPADLIDKFYRALSGVRLENLYGPTEATIYATGCSIKPGNGQAGSIGKPVANTRIYIVNEVGHIQPIGIAGELCISGDGVAVGYLNNAALTAEKFVQASFKPSERLYRTGDLARWRSDGQIEYLGRLDYQVKIRGNRIELDEVRQKILTCEGIEDTIVIARYTAGGQAYLCAYFIAEASCSVKSIRKQLAKLLPDYMIPSYFVQLAAFPHTASGKVDRKQLPEPEGYIECTEDYVGPRNGFEQRLCLIWENLLHLDAVGVLEDFYALGGDSIKAIQVVSKFNDNEHGWRISVSDVLTYRTIEAIALQVVTSGSFVTYDQGLLIGKKGLTPIEHWFMDSVLANPHHFNQSVMLEWHHSPNVQWLEQAFQLLVKHHDGLRLNVNLEQQELFFNEHHANAPFEVQQIDLTMLDEREQHVQEQQLKYELKSACRIDQDLLIRAMLMKISEGKHKLLITAHHLLTDGVTWRILLDDFVYLYECFAAGRTPVLSQKTASLLDWYKHVDELAVSKAFVSEQSYWEIANAHSFKLPQDAETDDWSIERQKTVSSSLDRSKSQLLRAEAHWAFQTEINDLLLTALSRAICDFAQVSEYVVVMENHGRHAESLDLSRTVGWFTSMYPLKLGFPSDDMGEQIKRIKEQFRSVPNNGVGYGVLRYLNDAWLEDKREMVELRFNYLGQFNQEFNNELFRFSEMSSVGEIGESNTMATKMDLNCYMMNDVFHVELGYNGLAYQEETMQALVDSFIHQLMSIVDFSVAQEEVQYTPSDFEAAELDQESLDLLFE